MDIFIAPYFRPPRYSLAPPAPAAETGYRDHINKET